MAERGRKVGWRKPEGIRTQRQMKAYDEEWELIRRFAKEVKHGDIEKCKKFISALDG